MLSILIPTYNYPIVKLVKTLYNQAIETNISFEILVVDDCSTKKELVSSNSEIENLSNCRFIQNEKNIGRTATRQYLAKIAAFDILLFLDADVLPEKTAFIKNYLSELKKNDADVIFGGITYEKLSPKKDKILRWKYGNDREAKSVSERKKDPYFIISQNLLIKRSVFLNANTTTENYYGLDNFFSNQLKKMGANVLHIDNPVIHFGLEENKIFIKKALAAVETTVILESKGLMDTNMRPIQKSFLKLKKYYLLNCFSFIISKFKKVMEQNMYSENPNLFWFDLYRLNYYIQLKKKYNA
ncbi:glycosyltransferase family A protein [Aequorivita sp. Q41]|uniref:glycosyltransferase family 2 protein n=1 Tax=Aequorivita sp. Q41 TaxID=3153300 RepID=UPI0032429F71